MRMIELFMGNIILIASAMVIGGVLWLIYRFKNTSIFDDLEDSEPEGKED